MGSRAERHIFLHCGWRTAGTWIWSQFRRCDGVAGFYEPLNESLGTMTLRTMPAMRPGASDSRHPEPERPYFEEYAPLLSPIKPGTRGFQPSFAYDEFFANHDANASLAEYLTSLLELAESHTKTAVLKFCRSLTRIDWLQRTFPDAFHVLVLREPLSQWESGWRLWAKESNPYFLVMPMRILAQHHREPWIATALEGLRLRPEDCVLPLKHRACCTAVRTMPVSFLYRAFLALWIATTLRAMSFSENYIETDRLELPAYREEVETLLERETGFRIDLTSATHLGRSESFLDPREVRSAHLDALEVLDRLELQVSGRGRDGAKFLRAKLHEGLMPQLQTPSLVHSTTNGRAAQWPATNQS
ncbi:MAG: hypothetical protein ACRENA_07830 [Vulcanimicrobiaceae bacterium]